MKNKRGVVSRDFEGGVLLGEDRKRALNAEENDFFFKFQYMHTYICVYIIWVFEHSRLPVRKYGFSLCARAYVSCSWNTPTS